MISKVVIADDDGIFRFTTKIKIERKGYAKEVQFCADGQEIVNLIKNSDVDDLPDILLLDINMPEIDGWDFLSLYSSFSEEKQEKMNVYMLSSSINPEDVRRAEDSPYVVDYISKPIRDEDLQKIFQ